MIKVLAAARRRPGMTHAEYIDYLQGVHADLTRENPLALRRYVQNHVFDGGFYASEGAYPSFFHRDSVVELGFDSMPDLQATFSHPYTRDVIAADGKNFSDLPTALSVLTTECVIQDAPPVGHCTKVLHWVKFASNAADRGAPGLLETAHAQALAAVPDLPARLKGLVWNIALPPKAGDQDKKRDGHFGGAVMPVYDAVIASWYAKDDDMSVFRTYENALMASGFFDQALSFFVYAEEVAIIG